MFFPLTAPLDILITTLAIIGFVGDDHAPPPERLGARRDRPRVRRPASTSPSDSLPVIGLLWNPRLLPFVYLVRYLLMMVGAVELIGWVER